MGSSELEAWPQREKGVVFGKRGKGLQGENRVLGMCSSWSGERNNQERKRQREPGLRRETQMQMLWWQLER